MLTRDCPVGVSAHRRKLVGLGLAAASVVGLTAAAAVVGESMETDECVPLPPIADVGAPNATADATPAPEDTSWIEKRRAQLGPREHHLVMGRMTVQVIGPKKP